MSQIVPVTHERHARRHWQGGANFAFARNRAVVPLGAVELARAALALPIALLRDADGVFPVALLSLDAQSNLFVAPDSRWIGRYVPAMLRGHPFAALPDNHGTMVLCIDEAAGLVPEGQSGTPFFEDDGQISAPTRSVLDFLTMLEKSKLAARQALASLDALGLVVPWDITLSSTSGEQKVAGLHRIDEAALNALADADFAGLRAGGAVGAAYCQILSMPNLEILVRLSEARAAHQAEDRTLLERAIMGPDTFDLDIDWDMFAEAPSNGEDTRADADNDAAPHHDPDRA